MAYFMLKSHFFHRKPSSSSSENNHWWKKREIQKRIFYWKILEGDPCPNFFSKNFFISKESWQIIYHSMQFCALILNMMFLLNKNVSESRKMWNTWKNHVFFENLLYSPGTFMLIYATCGHMGEHSGKVWISFKFGAGGGAHFTNIAVWKSTVEKNNIFF